MSKNRKAYLIKPETISGTLGFKKTKYRVIEIERIGETHLRDSEGYGWPYYLNTVENIKGTLFNSVRKANAFITEMEKGVEPYEKITFDDWTSVCSMGDPGDYPLEGGAPVYIKKEEK